MRLLKTRTYKGPLDSLKCPGGIWWRSARGFACAFATDQHDDRSACPTQCARLRVTHHQELCYFHQTPHPCASVPHTPAEAWVCVCHHLAPAAGSSTHACRMYFNRRSKKIHSEGGMLSIICRHGRRILELFTRVFSSVLCCCSLPLDIRMLLYV